MTVKKESVWRWISTVGLVVLAIICLSVKFDFYYDLNDDTVIRDIVSGIYTGTPSGYCIQMLYPLNLLIALCYRAIPGVAWYGLFLCLCQFTCLGIVLYHTFQATQRRWFQITISILLCFGLLGALARQWVILQYTVTSGMLMATAIYLYTLREEKKMLSIVLVLLSFCIRTEMCLMLFPFLLLVGFMKWCSEEKPLSKANVRKYLLTIGSALICMVLLWGMDRLSYQWNENHVQWQEYRAFFDARTKLYDFYGIPDYEEELGITREQYELLLNYNFALDEEIDSNMLERIVDYQKQKLHPVLGVLYTKHTIGEALWLYRRQISTLSNGIGSIIVLLAYLLYFFQSIRLGERKNLWNILGLLFIRSILWIYLLLVDRLPERVTIPLLLTEAAVLVGWILYTWTQFANKNKTTKFMQYGMLLVLLLVGFTAWEQNYPRLQQEYAAREEILPRYSAYLRYCATNPDKYYALDVYSSTSHQGTAYSEKIFQNVDNSYRNQDICGGWLAKSPLTNEKQKKYAIENIADGLLSQQAYFVAAAGKDVSWLEQYYASKGKRVSVSPVEDIMVQAESAFTVYEVNTYER